MTQHLHVSIAPVQSFVAQSRRTRDLWGSSYLLSYLSAHAMSGARQGGTIIRPLVDRDPMLQLVEGRATADPPRLGTLPNQFTVELNDDVDAVGIASLAERSLLTAWRRVCLAVWNHFVAPAAPAGHGTEAIWNRQIEKFWEVVWVVAAPNEPGQLIRRKYWRTHWLPEESGDKCTVMPELQELSGYVRSSGRLRQDAFWNAVRVRAGASDLADKERLSAIALVKRLYARVGEQSLGFNLDVTHWPSTVDVAAVPWRQRLIEIGSPEAEAYACEVVKLSNGTGADSSSVVGDLSCRTPQLTRLDANWFHHSFVASSRDIQLCEGDRKALCARLKSLTADRDSVESTKGPPIYFALLLADGDQLGKLVASLGGEVVSKALEEFMGAVTSIVHKGSGVTVYAGGDDVLALLPLDGALECASELEQVYRKSFSRAKDATLSVAVVFAHARDPLSEILCEAHRLLDEVAKEENCRSSLAAGVYRGGAAAVQWVTTWERQGLERTSNSVECLRAVVRELQANSGRLSGAWLHSIQQTLGVICETSSFAPGSFARCGEEIDVLALLVVEIEHRLKHRGVDLLPDEAAQLARFVRDVLGRSRNAKDESHEIGIDGLLLAWFLAGGGHEEEHE